MRPQYVDMPLGASSIFWPWRTSETLNVQSPCSLLGETNATPSTQIETKGQDTVIQYQVSASVSKFQRGTAYDQYTVRFKEPAKCMP